MTPLERAARAVAKSHFGYEAWDLEDDDGKQRLLSDVRAVIAAIREPIEEAAVFLSSTAGDGDHPAIRRNLADRLNALLEERA